MNILITGFAGSLGSEFTRQLLERGDHVTGVDSNEWAVAAFPDHPFLTKMLRDFGNVRGEYDLVIHCAAYKHIDLIESNREAATYNNVFLTKCLYAAAKGPKLFISTDKAVEPSSHYGETKRLGEVMTLSQGGMVARLGNIMGSSGSVIPRWESAIDKGEPLMVTDFNMTRYMIDVSDAVQRILSLLPWAAPGDTIVPDMGDPVILTDILARVLAKHGLPADYPTKVIGLRPAEKMHEKLKWDDENITYSNPSGIIVRR